MANIFRPGTWIRTSDQHVEQGLTADNASGKTGIQQIEDEPSTCRATAINPPRRSIVERIEERAYFKWRQEGCRPGKALDYWLAAEREILDES